MIPTNIVEQLEQIFKTKHIISIDIHIDALTHPKALVTCRVKEDEVYKIVDVLMQADWKFIEELTNGSTDGISDRSEDKGSDKQ